MTHTHTQITVISFAGLMCNSVQEVTRIIQKELPRLREKTIGSTVGHTVLGIKVRLNGRSRERERKQVTGEIIYHICYAKMHCKCVQVSSFLIT